MQYMGGKYRIAKHIAERVNAVREPGQRVWDAFCGGISVSVALRKHGPVLSTDINASLISLYTSVASGWVPPDEVSLETYRAARSLPDIDPMKAFCGFGCSFGGKWFGGWGGPSKCHPSGLAIYAKNSLMKAGLERLELANVDFMSVEPASTDSILYLDPPYFGVTGYDGAPSFDRDRFVSRVVEWSRFTHVFVSEYAFPIGSIVFEKPSKTKLNGGISGKALNATERLYYIGKSA